MGEPGKLQPIETRLVIYPAFSFKLGLLLGTLEELVREGNEAKRDGETDIVLPTSDLDRMEGMIKDVKRHFFTEIVPPPKPITIPAGAL